MAIQNARILIRRGNEVDFDANNMQPGEWALSTDEKIVRICVAPGVCIRMATYDAFETDMAKIEAILEQAKSIKEAVTLINTEVSENAKAVAEYTEQAKQYRDEAEQFRNEAEAFAPEGYSELVQNVEENTVKIETILEKGGLTFDESASGENIHLTDTTDNKVTAFALYGKATQDGTPTQDAPVEIEIAGASGSVEVVSENEDSTKSTNAIIPTPNGLCGIKVSSGGNYTDENGQQWISDSIVKYADGSGDKIKMVESVVFDGSPDENWIKSSNAGNISYYISKTTSGSLNVGDGGLGLLCNRFQTYKTEDLVEKDTVGCSYGYRGRGELRIGFGLSSKVNTVDLFRTWLSNNPVEMVYQLKTPLRTPLTAEQLAEIEKLQTLYPVTNISNDADCYMEVAYKADAKNYIDNIILSRVATLETAVINNL